MAVTVEDVGTESLMDPCESGFGTILWESRENPNQFLAAVAAQTIIRPGRGTEP
jgi:hypothetical protein